MANKKMTALACVVVVGLLALACAGCASVSVNGESLGGSDTSVAWSMTKTGSEPNLASATKLSNLSKDAQAVYNYAKSAGAEGDTWYTLTAPEKPGETYYAFKQMNGSSYTWLVYKAN